jgi:death-on-curing protein
LRTNYAGSALDRRNWSTSRLSWPKAAAYAFGIARNHPFVDGNKRAAFASIIVFLGLNGVDFDAPPEAATAIILGMAAGEIDEDGLARWIADNISDAPSLKP